MRDMHECDGEIKAGAPDSTRDGELWFKFFPEAWLDAMQELTAEQAGYYIGCLCLMYRDNRALRDDDGWIAHQLHKDIRQWRRVRRELFDLGKLWIGADAMIHNSKVDEVLTERAGKVRKLTSKPRKRRALGDAPRAPIADTSPGATRIAPLELPVHLEKSSNEINGPRRGDLRVEIEKETTVSFCAGAQKDDRQLDVVFRDDKLTLHNGLRSFWLEQFGGDAQRLDLALIQAAGFVQANSSRPLEAQVGAQLARQAADKRDRDKRYAAAAERKPKAAGGDELPAWRREIKDKLARMHATNARLS